MAEDMNTNHSISALLSTVSVIVLSGLFVFLTKLYRARKLIHQLQERGLPVAPNHSFLFGHLLYLKTYIDRLPKGAHYQFAFGTIAREQFYDEGCFYIDLWPMSGLFLTIVTPKTAIEVTQTNTQLTSERPYLLRRFMKPITGGLTIFDLPEKEWKPWRLAFSKGFQKDRLLAMIPNIVEETLTYRDTLTKIADRQELCFLDPVTLRFTIDMIGRTVLNSELGAQKGYNALADGMLNQVSWLDANEEVNPLSSLNLIAKFMRWKNGRDMDNYISAELDKRYEVFKADYENHLSGTSTSSVIDMVLKAQLSMSGSSPPEKLDAEFKSVAIRQIRLFVFAGHDSTGSVICYCFHLLHLHPKVLARLRAEHDEVFGKAPDSAAKVLRNNPNKVNNLNYTLAVIKETMRLFAPAGTTRAGKPGVNITDDAGNNLPTDDTILWILHVEMHRHPKYWLRAQEFLPERWLVEPGHELYPTKGAWRPFEHGPRNCIAQSLALVELKVILSCLIREVEIIPAYDEWDAAHPAKGVNTYRGDRAYQVQGGAAHPAHQYPCTVRKVG